MKVLRTIVLTVSWAALVPLAAAAKPAIPSPYTMRPCASPDDAITDLGAPGGLYVNAGDKCPAVCRKAERQCERYVKLAVACHRASTQDEVGYAKLSCNVTLGGPEKKTCLEQAGSDGAEERNLLDAAQRNDIAQCQSWGQSCVAGCP